jgi:hypothetical protein
METDQGRNAYNTTKAMADLQEWSYGYNVLPPAGPGMFDGKRVRELRKLDVFEVSPVLKGAGVGTATLAIKSGAPGADAPYAELLLVLGRACRISWIGSRIARPSAQGGPCLSARTIAPRSRISSTPSTGIS